jgi:hypothetical protein
MVSFPLYPFQSGSKTQFLTHARELLEFRTILQVNRRNTPYANWMEAQGSGPGWYPLPANRIALWPPQQSSREVILIYSIYQQDMCYRLTISCEWQDLDTRSSHSHSPLADYPKEVVGAHFAHGLTSLLYAMKGITRLLLRRASICSN